jgi:hypothetical protein
VQWPAEQAAPVLDAYRELTATAPEHLTAWYALLHFPEGPPLVAVEVTFLGEAAEGEALLRGLDRIEGRLSDSRETMVVADLGDITAEPTDPAPGVSRSELLTELDDQVAARLLDRPIDPLLTVQIRHLGGALGQPADSAAGHLDEPYALYLYGIPTDGVRERQASLAGALNPYTSGRKPFSLLAREEQAANAFSADTLARLRAVKAARDPHGVFRSNFAVL